MKRGLFYRLLLIYIGRFDVSNKTINSEKE